MKETTPITSVQTLAHGLLGKADEWLQLLADGGPLAGNRLLVAGTKCLVGADPHCTLHLPLPGVDPVHCLLLHGHQASAVRSFATPVLVNGRPVFESLLRDGDRLTIGTQAFRIARRNLVAGQAPGVSAENSAVDPTARGRQVVALGLNDMVASDSEAKLDSIYHQASVERRAKRRRRKTSRRAPSGAAQQRSANSAPETTNNASRMATGGSQPEIGSSSSESPAGSPVSMSARNGVPASSRKESQPAFAKPVQRSEKQSHRAHPPTATAVNVGSSPDALTTAGNFGSSLDAPATQSPASWRQSPTLDRAHHPSLVSQEAKLPPDEQLLSNLPMDGHLPADGLPDRGLLTTVFPSGALQLGVLTSQSSIQVNLQPWSQPVLTNRARAQQARGSGPGGQHKDQSARQRAMSETGFQIKAGDVLDQVPAAAFPENSSGNTTSANQATAEANVVVTCESPAWSCEPSASAPFAPVMTNHPRPGRSPGSRVTASRSAAELASERAFLAQQERWQVVSQQWPTPDQTLADRKAKSSMAGQPTRVVRDAVSLADTAQAKIISNFNSAQGIADSGRMRGWRDASYPPATSCMLVDESSGPSALDWRESSSVSRSNTSDGIAASLYDFAEPVSLDASGVVGGEGTAIETVLDAVSESQLSEIAELSRQLDLLSQAIKEQDRCARPRDEASQQKSSRFSKTSVTQERRLELGDVQLHAIPRELPPKLSGQGTAAMSELQKQIDQVRDQLRMLIERQTGADVEPAVAIDYLVSSCREPLDTDPESNVAHAWIPWDWAANALTCEDPAAGYPPYAYESLSTDSNSATPAFGESLVEHESPNQNLAHPPLVSSPDSSLILPPPSHPVAEAQANVAQVGWQPESQQATLRQATLRQAELQQADVQQTESLRSENLQAYSTPVDAQPTTSQPTASQPADMEQTERQKWNEDWQALREPFFAVSLFDSEQNRESCDEVLKQEPFEQGAWAEAIETEVTRSQATPPHAWNEAADDDTDPWYPLAEAVAPLRSDDLGAVQWQAEHSDLPWPAWRDRIAQGDDPWATWFRLAGKDHDAEKEPFILRSRVVAHDQNGELAATVQSTAQTDPIHPASAYADESQRQRPPVSTSSTAAYATTGAITTESGASRLSPASATCGGASEVDLFPSNMLSDESTPGASSTADLAASNNSIDNARQAVDSPDEQAALASPVMNCPANERPTTQESARGDRLSLYERLLGATFEAAGVLADHGFVPSKTASEPASISAAEQSTKETPEAPVHDPRCTQDGAPCRAIESMSPPAASLPHANAPTSSDQDWDEELTAEAPPTASPSARPDHIAISTDSQGPDASSVDLPIHRSSNLLTGDHATLEPVSSGVEIAVSPQTATALVADYTVHVSPAEVVTMEGVTIESLNTQPSELRLTGQRETRSGEASGSSANAARATKLEPQHALQESVPSHLARLVRSPLPVSPLAISPSVNVGITRPTQEQTGEAGLRDHSTGASELPVSLEVNAAREGVRVEVAGEGGEAYRDRVMMVDREPASNTQTIASHALLRELVRENQLPGERPAISDGSPTAINSWTGLSGESRASLSADTNAVRIDRRGAPALQALWESLSSRTSDDPQHRRLNPSGAAEERIPLQHAEAQAMEVLATSMPGPRIAEAQTAVELPDMTRMTWATSSLKWDDVSASTKALAPANASAEFEPSQVMPLAPEAVTAITPRGPLVVRPVTTVPVADRIVAPGTGSSSTTTSISDIEPRAVATAATVSGSPASSVSRTAMRGWEAETYRQTDTNAAFRTQGSPETAPSAIVDQAPSSNPALDALARLSRAGIWKGSLEDDLDKTDSDADALPVTSPQARESSAPQEIPATPETNWSHAPELPPELERDLRTTDSTVTARTGQGSTEAYLSPASSRTTWLTPSPAQAPSPLDANRSEQAPLAVSPAIGPTPMTVPVMMTPSVSSIVAPAMAAAPAMTGPAMTAPAMTGPAMTGPDRMPAVAATTSATGGVLPGVATPGPHLAPALAPTVAPPMIAAPAPVMPAPTPMLNMSSTDEAGSKLAFRWPQGEADVVSMSTHINITANQSITQQEVPHDDHEASMEAYMNQLLARMRGEPVTSVETASRTVTTVSELADEPGVRKLRMHREPLLTTEATSYQPRGEAPLVVANIELMRQIANESTRNAIAVHARNSWLDAARANLIGAIAGIVGALLSLLYWNSNLLLALLGVTTGLAVTAWLGQRVWLIRKELFSVPQARRQQSRMDRPHADRSADETSS